MILKDVELERLDDGRSAPARPSMPSCRGLDAASITAALGQVITRPAELCCDGGAAIIAFARRARVKFHVLPAPGTPKPEAPDLHINNVNAYHGRLKGCGASMASPPRTSRAI